MLSSQTIGVEFSSKIVKVGTGPGRRRVKLQLWDTAGTERFRSVSRSYYRGAAGAILVYDVASIASFNALPTFFMDAKALASPNLAVILAGNKVDLADGKQSEYDTTASSASSWQSSFPMDGASSTRSILPGSRMTATKAGQGREVEPDVVTRWASKSGIPVVTEVSALSGENVDELFAKLARIIVTKVELGEIDPDDPQSGISYGDLGGTWDNNSITSGLTADDGTTRRRKGKNVLAGFDEMGNVFRKSGRRGCC